MGKGDQKTRRGKITAGSYGKSRPKKSSSKMVVAVAKPAKEKLAEPKAEKPKKVAKPKNETADETPKIVKKKKTEE